MQLLIPSISHASKNTSPTVSMNMPMAEAMIKAYIIEVTDVMHD